MQAPACLPWEATSLLERQTPADAILHLQVKQEYNLGSSIQTARSDHLCMVSQINISLIYWEI